MGFSPSDQLLAVGDENSVVILDLEALEPIRELPIEGSSSFHWFDEETFLMGTSVPARWVSVSIDVDQLEAAGIEGVTRSFSELECAEYAIDPCPTLDEIRSR